MILGGWSLSRATSTCRRDRDVEKGKGDVVHTEGLHTHFEQEEGSHRTGGHRHTHYLHSHEAEEVPVRTENETKQQRETQKKEEDDHRGRGDERYGNAYQD